MIYPNDIENLLATRRKVSLPIGVPAGHGNLIFLMSDGIKTSINMMSSEETFDPNRRYRYYYFTAKYNGKVNGKIYNKIFMKQRDTIYEEVEANTRIVSYPTLSINKDSNVNTYYELSEYINIFNDLSSTLTPLKRAASFWSYIMSIINRGNFSKYQNKYILIDARIYKNFKGSIKELIKNPLYILYYSMYKDITMLKDVNIDILIYTGKHYMKVNPSLSTKVSYRIFLRELKKMLGNSPTIPDESESEKLLESQEVESIASTVMNTKFNFVGDQPTSDNPVPEEVQTKEKIETITKNVVDKTVNPTTKVSKKTIDSIADDVETQINSDTKIISQLYSSTMKNTGVKSSASTARDAMLRKQQEEIQVDGMKVKDIRKISITHKDIPSNNVSTSVRTINDNMKNIRFTNFEKAYNEHGMQKDIINAFTSLSEKELPLFIRDIKKEDTSDELNYKMTYTVLLEDTNRQRHTLKVDLPQFIDDKFMYLGGNKKLIIKQNFLLPIVKTGPDTVQIVTNYNKMFIKRVDTRSISSLSRLLKLVETNDDVKKYFTFGNTVGSNASVITTIEYDEFSKVMIKFNNNGTTVMFNQGDVDEYVKSKGITVPKNSLCIGEKNGKPLFVNLDTQKTPENETICDLIYESLNDVEKSIYEKIKSPKRLMYTNVKTMEQYIPVVVLLFFWEGMDKVLKKAKINYRLEKNYPANLKPSEAVVRFADAYMVYEDTMSTSLLLNGIRNLSTEKYNITDFDTPEPFIEYFKKVYGKVAIANTLINSYEFTIDPITLEILKDQNLPTDIVSLMIYANNLLADSQYQLEIKEHLYRVRSNEIVAAILYDSIAKNYINYKNSNGKKKFSVQNDIVIKQLLKLKTVEDYSTLNPLLELERTRSISTRGWRGANLDRAYTMEKRTYDPSMIGVMGLSSSPDAQVGVAKTLTMEPVIRSLRGYVDVHEGDRINELKDVNLFSPAELGVPLGVTRDSPTRTGHSVKQSKHVIPVKVSSPVLISNGIEEVCRFNLSSDFVVNAKDDGEIIDYKPKLNLLIAKYNDGTHQAINLAPNIVKNGGGGFYLSNKMETALKLGDKFKKNDALCWHKDFFTNNKFNGLRMNMGTLSKVAIMSTYNTYEDSTFITEKLAKEAATEMVFPKQAVIGKNSNISYIVNVGDNIEVGDRLIQFDTSFDDSALNEFLANLSSDSRLKDEIIDNSKNTIKSSHAGVIEDIKIYSSVDIEEMSPSLREIVSAYYKKIQAKKSFLNKYDPKGSIVKCGILMTEPTGKVEPNKFGVIKGQKVEDSVMIEFYIKHTEYLEVASKIANFTAIKNTIGEIIPAGFEPRSEFRPEEEISTIIASNSILKRMTPSITLTALGNKCIIELKRKLQEIYMEDKK